jgi:hypothetical protein
LAQLEPDGQQVSEKIWLAADCAVKEVAKKINVRIFGHDVKGTFTDFLTSQYQDLVYAEFFSIAEKHHKKQ